MPPQTASGVRMLRPSEEEARAVCDALALLHGRPSTSDAVKSEGCEISKPHSVLDSLVRRQVHAAHERHVYLSATLPAIAMLEQQHTNACPRTQVRTMLSQNTTDITSARAFASLKAAFPTWEGVRDAPPGVFSLSVSQSHQQHAALQRLQ